MKKFSFIVPLILLGLACNKPSVQVGNQPPIPERVQIVEPDIKVTTTTTKGAPAWIDKNQGGLQAVGIAEPNSLHNKAMQREVAINRGMALASKQLEVRVESLYQEFMAVNNKGQKHPPAVDEVNNTIRNIVSVKVRGATTNTFWTDSQDGTLYVLVRLPDNTDQESLHETLLKEGIKDLDATLTSKGL